MQYAGTATQSLRAAAAWRLACLTVFAALVVVCFIAFRIAGVQRTVLVPYGMMSANGKVEITGTIKENKQYLILLAKSDIQTLLTWQPATIKQQLNALLARLTPTAYAEYNLKLRNTAQQYAAMNLSQVFWPTSIAFKPPNTVIFKGTLKRYAGEELKLSSRVTYRLHYKTANGIYAINKIETVEK